jgi:hypothetical protein
VYKTRQHVLDTTVDLCREDHRFVDLKANEVLVRMSFWDGGFMCTGRPCRNKKLPDSSATKSASRTIPRVLSYLSGTSPF